MVQYPRIGSQPGEEASAVVLETPTNDLQEPRKANSTSEGSLPEDEESSAQEYSRGEDVETSTTPDLQSEKTQI